MPFSPSLPFNKIMVDLFNSVPLSSIDPMSLDSLNIQKNIDIYPECNQWMNFYIPLGSKSPLFYGWRNGFPSKSSMSKLLFWTWDCQFQSPQLGETSLHALCQASKNFVCFKEKIHFILGQESNVQKMKIRKPHILEIWNKNWKCTCGKIDKLNVSHQKPF